MMTAQSASTSASTSQLKRTALLGHFLSGILSLVFLTSAVAKTRSFHELEATLAASRLVPVLLVSQAATLLLVTEFLLAFLLLLPVTRRPALHASTVLVSMFAAYSIWHWMQGIPVPCHCFGILFQLSPAQSITLNLGLLLLIGGLLAKSENLGSVPVSLAQRGKTPETTA